MFCKVCIWITALFALGLGHVFIQISKDKWFKMFGGCLCSLSGILIIMGVM